MAWPPARKKRNIEKLIVLVEENTYARTRRLAQSFESKDLSTGSRDCCTFVDYIARAAGLKTSSEKYLYPQDHFLRLKQINQTR